MAALLLFCKRPEIGFGKQRLASEIGLEAAYEVSKLLLNCALEDFALWDGPKFLAPYGEEDCFWATDLIEKMACENSTVFPQSDGNMGERIEKLDKQIRETGEDMIIVIGSDSPAMDMKQYKEAEKLLREKDIVICPASDGGVTLMANSIPWPDLSDLHWGKDSFAESLVNSSKDQALSVGYTVGSFDIDNREDLLYYYKHSLAEKRTARIDLRDWIKEVLL